MKKLLSALAVLFTATLQAQITSGTITYEFYTEDKTTDLSEQPNLRPKKRHIIEFNEQFTRTSFISATASTYVDIWDKTAGHHISYATDPEDKTICFYDLDISKAKIEQKYGKKDEEQDQKNDTVVEVTGETKKILGFPCKKTILTIRGEQIIVAWSTGEIKGVENTYNLAPYVEGTIMSYSVTSEYMTLQFYAVDFSKTNTIDEKTLYNIPQDYNLVLGPLYLKPHVKEYNVEELLEIPAFITFPFSKETVTKITNEIDKSIHSEQLKSPDNYIEITIYFDEKGVINSVEFEDSEEIGPRTYSRNELTAAIKKNCALKAPITANGKIAPVILKIDYTFN